MTKEQAIMYCRTVQGYSQTCVICGENYPDPGVPYIPVQKDDGDWSVLAICSQKCTTKWVRQHASSGAEMDGRERSRAHGGDR